MIEYVRESKRQEASYSVKLLKNHETLYHKDVQRVFS